MFRVREPVAFAATLAALLLGFFCESLIGGKVLSSGDVVYASSSFGDGSYEPANRLLMDPVLQFAPWFEFNRSMLRSGRLPLWNPWVGCGAPHLANGQSAVFDPFQIIAYVGSPPKANAWMAFLRLWTAGFGMFLLARSWGLGRWGRWFAGLCFPLAGFLVVWLLYPVTNVAIWLPWLLLANDRVLDRPSTKRAASLAVAVGLVLLGGHIQTSAHVLLYSGLYATWRCWQRGFDSIAKKLAAPATWAGAVLLGILLASIEIIPLASYLSRSPVWSDRTAEAAVTNKHATPRLLDATCLGFPYAFGSQRRGQPNLARALHVNNLNESAGGFAGLATLIWLAPLAFLSRKRLPRVTFLASITILGGLGAFGIPPVINLLQALPILKVADNRRLLLWVAFGLVMLGGIGLDSLEDFVNSRAWRWWTRSWFIAATVFAIAAISVGHAGSWIRAKSIAHYAKAATSEPGADAKIYRQRAEHQADLAITFLPRYYALAAGQLIILALLAEGMRRNRFGLKRSRSALFGLTLIDLIAFGFGLNPAISVGDDRPDSDVISYLRREIPPPLKIVSVGAELPPNLLMRYGLADARNYDSVELSRSINWFEPMYEPDPDRPIHTSRRTVRWEGVTRAKERLRMAGVIAVVGTLAPPEGVFERVDRVGRLYVGRWTSLAPVVMKHEPGEIRVDLRGKNGQVRWVAETFDPGWTATIDGHATAITPYRDAFLGVDVPANARELIFRYEPFDVHIAMILSLTSLVAIAVLACLGIPRRIPC